MSYRPNVIFLFILFFGSVLTTQHSIQAQSSPFVLLQPSPVNYELKAGFGIYGSTDVQTPLSGTADFSHAWSRGKWKSDITDPNSLAIGFKYDHFNISSDVAVLPDHMDQMEIGIASRVYETDHWLINAGAGIGYSSIETPFADGEAIYFTGYLSGSRRLGEKAKLTVYMHYDENRSFMPDVPLPGFAYERQVNDKLSLVLGFPILMARWKPNEKHLINAYIATGFETYSIYYRYAATDKLAFFASAKSELKSFHISSGIENRRIFYGQQALETGLSYRIGPIEAQLAFGYAIDRNFEWGFDTRNSRLIAELENEPYLKFQITGRMR